jgi:hypothetical protein
MLKAMRLAAVGIVTLIGLAGGGCTATVLDTLVSKNDPELALTSKLTPLADAGWCWVFATQYNPNNKDSVEVALPDKYIKFANRGWKMPDQYKKYYNNPPYTVTIQRIEGQKVYTARNILVNEVGPWNEDDNYWDKSAPSATKSPRRRFTDLALCMPEAQAAFSKGYNNGLDQFKRKVKNQAGLDLSPEVAKLLGLKPLQNAWVYVYYGNLP